MNKEEYITLLNISTNYKLDYLQHLSLEELRKLYEEKVDHGENKQR